METFSALLAICEGNSPVPGEFPAQRPVTRGFDNFFDLRLNKRLSKQYRAHNDVIVMTQKCYIDVATCPCPYLNDGLPYLAQTSWQTGTRVNIKTVFPRYGDSHVKDKTVAKPSYL